MRHDAAYGNLLDDFPKLIEFFSAALAIEQPIHIGVLHESEQGIFGPHLFDARSARIRRAFAKKINDTERFFLVGKLGADAIERQIAFFPSGRQSRESIGIANKFDYSIGP